MLIRKADGTSETFSEEKLLHSIRRAGVPQEFAPTVLAHAKSKLYEGIPTAELYKHVSEFLEKSPHPFTKTRYILKQSIMNLGPTGYPFEDYVANVLQKQGYITKVRQIVQGKCVSHEIDVIAEKENEVLMVEAKFHNGFETKTDIQVSMYTKARFDDITQKNNFTKALLITNTKATSDAIAYAECVNMRIIGWSYPNGDSLRDIVEKFHLYPLTALTSLPQHFKEQLLQKSIVLCEDIYSDPSVLAEENVPDDLQKKVLQELTFLHQSTVA